MSNQGHFDTSTLKILTVALTEQVMGELEHAIKLNVLDYLLAIINKDNVTDFETFRLELIKQGKSAVTETEERHGK